MAYDRVITELNNARLRGTSYPLVHALIDASRSVASDVSLSPSIRKILVLSFHVVSRHPNDPKLPRARSNHPRTTRPASHGARRSSHSQRPTLRAQVRTSVPGQPLWAKLFYLVRTGHVQEALAEATQFQQALENREASFVTLFRTWVESPNRK